MFSHVWIRWYSFCTIQLGVWVRTRVLLRVQKDLRIQQIQRRHPCRSDSMSQSSPECVLDASNWVRHYCKVQVITELKLYHDVKDTNQRNPTLRSQTGASFVPGMLQQLPTPLPVISGYYPYQFWTLMTSFWTLTSSRALTTPGSSTLSINTYVRNFQRSSLPWEME